MNARVILRSSICALAALAAGCAGPRADKDSPQLFLSGTSAKRVKSATPTTDNTATADPARGAAPGPVAGSPPATTSQSRGGVVQAGGVAPAQVPPSPVVPITPPALPPPTPVPQPGAVPGIPPVAPNTPGIPPTTPGVSSMPGLPSGGTIVPPGLHVRGAPTALGSLLNLAPGENPTDKMVDLAKMVEAGTIENRALVGRIKELEAAAVTREQALAEALRDVDAATAEVARARADLLALRKELTSLKDRLEQVEKDDVETLRMVVTALEKLLQNPPPRAGGRGEP